MAFYYGYIIYCLLPSSGGCYMYKRVVTFQHHNCAGGARSLIIPINLCVNRIVVKIPCPSQPTFSHFRPLSTTFSHFQPLSAAFGVYFQGYFRRYFREVGGGYFQEVLSEGTFGDTFGGTFSNFRPFSGRNKAHVIGHITNTNWIPVILVREFSVTTIDIPDLLKTVKIILGVEK